MPRVKGGTVTRRRRKRVLKLAKGYRGAKHIQFKVAKDQVMVRANSVVFGLHGSTLLQE